MLIVFSAHASRHSSCLENPSFASCTTNIVQGQSLTVKAALRLNALGEPGERKERERENQVNILFTSNILGGNR